MQAWLAHLCGTGPHKENVHARGVQEKGTSGLVRRGLERIGGQAAPRGAPRSGGTSGSGSSRDTKHCRKTRLVCRCMWGGLSRGVGGW